MLDPQQWKEAFFVLQKSNLFICPGNNGAAEDIINLNRLQELSQSWVLVCRNSISDWSEPFCVCVEGITLENENQEKKEILVLVERGR